MPDNTAEQNTAHEHLTRVANGDEAAAEDLFPMVYDQLRRIASARMRGERSGHTLDPTALVNEAYMKIVGQRDANVQSKTHFVALASIAMQRILIDHARSKSTRKRGGDLARKEMHADIPGEDIRTDEALGALAEAVEKLSQVDQRKAAIVRLRMLGGLSVRECAAVLNVARSTVDADWATAKSWLAEELGLDLE